MEEDEIEYYKNIGAINAHLDSIDESLKELHDTFDRELIMLKSISDRL